MCSGVSRGNIPWFLRMGEVLFCDGEKTKKKKAFQGKFRLVNASQWMSSIHLERQDYISGGDARGMVLTNARLTFLDTWGPQSPGLLWLLFLGWKWYVSHFLTKGLYRDETYSPPFPAAANEDASCSDTAIRWWGLQQPGWLCGVQWPANAMEI